MNGSQLNSFECYNAECRIFVIAMLSVVTLNVVTLNVVTPLILPITNTLTLKNAVAYHGICTLRTFNVFVVPGPML
jgi:hypothetical protein